jgi:uncharacterized DUF497 family protein
VSVAFEWDGEKAKLNRRTHHVSFDEASTVFGDTLARIFDDPDHSAAEARALIVGYSARNRLMVVSFTERGRDRVRIISARLATRKERKHHEENQGR